MPHISFMTANFVARELDYAMPDWAAGDRATQDAFRPIATFADRFGGMLGEIAAMGFEAIDLWEAHLSPAWATDAHIATASELLAQRQLRVLSLAGWFGTKAAEVEGFCRIATALGAPLLGGRTSLLDSDRPALLRLLERHDLRFGLENHPEPTPSVVLERIGAADERIGATVDTGWFGTQGSDAATAILELAPRLMHVHLKDVVRAGEPHETCEYGAGIVPLAACVDALREIGYDGAISVEHVPADHDPTNEIRRSRAKLETWLAA